MTARKKHITAVRNLIAIMLPEQRAELTADRLKASYGLTDTEAEYLLRGVR